MATIDLNVLTNGTTQNNEWSGTGIFDILTNAVNKNIEIQYNKGRIKGTDYANVYLSSMQAVIAQSVQFLQQKQLTEAQIAQINIETEKATIEKNTILPKNAQLLETDKLLKEAQVSQINAQTAKIDIEKAINIYEKDVLLPKKVAVLASDKAFKDAQIAQVDAETLTILPKKSELLNAERLFKQAQVHQVNVETDKGAIEKASSLYQKDVVLPEKARLLYTERVLKDKQAAALGQDSVLKPENMRNVYTPHYEQTIPDSAAAPYNV